MVPRMRNEYDFTDAPRGKFAARVGRDAVFVTFDPDVSALLDGPGSLADRLRALLARSSRARRRRPGLVRSIALSPGEYKALRPILERIGGRVDTPSPGVARGASRRRKAG